MKYKYKRVFGVILLLTFILAMIYQQNLLAKSTLENIKIMHSLTARRKSQNILITGKKFVPVTMATKEDLQTSKTVTMSASLVQESKITCGTEWKDTDWSKKIEPQIHLRSDKFLYPAVMWGPNNQIDGLIQTMYLAIRLNRTMVLPMMLTHKNSPYSAYQRIDVDRLRRFMSLISVTEMQRKCSQSFDVAFISHAPNIKLIKKLEYLTNMNLFKHRDTKRMNSSFLLSSGTLVDETDHDCIPAFPMLSLGYKPNFTKYLNSNERFLRGIFPSQATCAVHLAPFKAINVAATREVGKLSFENISAITDAVLYSACKNSVQHTGVIIDISKNIINEYSSNKYTIAIHWRYDKADWQKHQCGLLNNSNCSKIKRITPEDVASGVIEKSKSLLSQQNKTVDDIGSIYLACPPTLKNTFIPEFKKVVAKNFPHIKVFSQIETQKYFNAHHKHCINTWQSEAEFLSVVEMEICRMSEIFFYSEVSSWSRFSLERRESMIGTATMDFSIVDVATEALMKRINASFEKNDYSI